MVFGSATAPSAAPLRSERDLLTAAAVDLAQWIKARTISSAEVVELAIRRIEQVNPSLNAVVHTRFEKARDEARETDRALARGDDLGPFAGVPCTIKEFFAVEGAPQTGGLVARKNTLSTSDAPTVARSRRLSSHT